MRDCIHSNDSYASTNTITGSALPTPVKVLLTLAMNAISGTLYLEMNILIGFSTNLEYHHQSNAVYFYTD